MYKEIIPYCYCPSQSLKEEERWLAKEPIVIRLSIIREIVPKKNTSYVVLKVTEDCFEDIVIKRNEAEEIKNILLGNNLNKEQGEQKPVEPFEIEHGKYYYCIKDYFCCGKKQASKGDVVQALRGLPIMGLKDASEYFLPVNFIKCNSAWSEEDEAKLKSILFHIEDVENKDVIDWLKSLKDRCLPQQKQEWSEEDSIRLQRIIDFLWYNRKGDTDTIYQQEQDIDWLKSLKDRVQPKQEWSEDDEHRREDAIYFLETAKKHYASTSEIELTIDWLKSLKDRCLPQQKTEWNEEDEKKLNTIIGYIVSKNELGLQYADWLKSLRPQKQEQWNEQDIEMIDWLIRCCEKEYEELCNDRYGHQEIVSDLKRDCRKKWDWLESLKSKVVPHNTWKPSDEQLDALQYVYRNINPPLSDKLGWNSLKTLELMYQDLKKLREE